MKKLQKYLLFALALSLLFTALLLPAHATEDTPANTWIEWEISENGDTLSGNGKEYSFVNVNFDHNIKVMPWIYDTYEFGNTVFWNGNTYTLTAIAKDAEIVVMNREDRYMLYATKAGAEAIADLADGQPQQYVLCERHYKTRNVKLDDAAATALLQQYVVPARVYNVQDLDALDSYTLYATDDSGSVCYISGRLYKLSDTQYGYVDHLSLNNTYFDANGSFSYRSGSVEVKLLNAAGIETAQEAVRSIRHNPQEYEYEWSEGMGHDDEYEDVYEGAARVLFWVMFSLLGFGLPVVPILLGLIKGLPKKRGTRYWLILAAIGAAWLLISVVLLVLFRVTGA